MKIHGFIFTVFVFFSIQSHADGYVSNKCTSMVKNPSYEAYRTMLVVMEQNPSLKRGVDTKKGSEYCKAADEAYYKYVSRNGLAVEIKHPVTQRDYIRTCEGKYNHVSVEKEFKRFKFILSILNGCKIGGSW